jgi:hypothetical protein
MRTSLWFAALSVPLLFGIGCKAREPEYRPTATIKDIMDSLVDPSADVLWESIATIISAAGIEERAPRTDEEWTNVRRNAIRLIEATNLLLMRRHVARPGEKAENPKVELGPEAIELVINDDRAQWTSLVYGLHDAAVPALTAIDARNVQGLSDAGAKIDVACESCHQKYWYPPPASPAWKK